MKQMWEATLVGILSGGEQGIRVIRHKRIKCFGVGESHLEKMLPDMIRRGRDPKVGITVSQATITLRITAAGETPDECAAKMEPTLLEVHQCLGELVFGTEEDELQHAVARLITNSDQTLATVECGTGGLVAHWIDEVDAMETRFVGGLIIPHPDALPRMLEIPLSLIQQHGAVSSEVTSAMAEACRQRTGADLALAVCQKSLPLQQGDENRIYVALARESGTIVRSTHSLGHPELHKPRAAKTALNLLRLALLRKDKPGQETTDHETTDKP
jgi:nicotinamide-nucleotide amidase